ncbi:cell wall metabolism sensor histidine kinase WalK [Streptomyces sp. FIT100]|uniref:sensor histidine kinase n=1 Tax=Streptomyces sp. FIT100 TaxID=2837956 RepID=UPI0021C859FC|nr:HAMP domain-containing sensor histidine kinase [Streptomyces sp. FIT100]UUN27733.1 HAMP domain-containing histidine kinase [Streptomyces sp. FIT100]
MTRGFHALPLRSRLALLTASAVALAVAAVAVTCWLLTRAQLHNELDTSLRNTSAPAGEVLDTWNACQNPRPESPGTGREFAYVQIVGPDGTRCVSAYSEPVKVDSQDIAVARGLSNNVLRAGTTDDGAEVRVHTQRVAISPRMGELAVSVSRPLHEIDAALNRLALLLSALAGIGVVAAGAAGLWVARTGLKPVDRLTDAVEHVARTEDLTVRIPVEGEDEIARLSRSFNQMTAALASSRDRQAQLIADAGHELRTPLTSLRTNIELLARSEQTGRALPPGDRAALLASVKAQMAELAALIGDLQELSRPDSAAPGPVRVVALHDIARTALERARLRGPELTITDELRPWYVRAEPAALERALVNVLDNAVKFSPPRGTVEVLLDRGVLTVRDHGSGIASDELPHVFERFWRSPSARALPGSGLGLSIVARTVHQAGGEVELRPAEGGGTVAVISLPGAPAPPPPSVVADERLDQT